MSEMSNPHAAQRGDTDLPERDAEPATMRAAIDRLQGLVSGDRDTRERVRAGLADLALAVARAKAQAIEPEAAASGKAVALALDEIEQRVAGLIALVDMPPPDAATAEAAEVPTVSHVVSQLGRGDETPVAEMPVEADKGVPSVSALGEMLEKLAASMLPDSPPPSPDTPTAPPTPLPLEPPTLAEPESEPSEDAAPLRKPTLPEADLLWNFERMESIPYMPPEPGAAVIFNKDTPRPEALHPDTPQLHARQHEARSPDAPSDTPEPHKPEPKTSEPALRDSEPAPAEPPTGPAPAAVETPDYAAPALPSEPTAFLSEQEPPVQSLRNPATGPADFLPEIVPASPAPEYAQAASTGNTVTGSPREPAADSSEPSSAPKSAAYDPLAPVRALSDAERIALFS